MLIVESVAMNLNHISCDALAAQLGLGATIVMALKLAEVFTHVVLGVNVMALLQSSLANADKVKRHSEVINVKILTIEIKEKQFVSF